MKKGDWIRDRHKADDNHQHRYAPYGYVQDVYTLDDVKVARVRFYDYDGASLLRQNAITKEVEPYTPRVHRADYVVVKPPQWAAKVQ